jgi:YggT family protein
MNPLEKAGVFLVGVIFGLYIFLLMLRFLLQWARIDFYHPMSQFLLMITSPPLRPIQRFVPNWHGVNLAALILMFVLQIIKRLLTHAMMGVKLSPIGLPILALADLLSLLLYVFIFSILIQVILSWVQMLQGSYIRNDLNTFLYRLNEPLLRPVRNAVPAYGGGIDFSPLIVTIILYLLIILVAEPLEMLGMYF